MEDLEEFRCAVKERILTLTESEASELLQAIAEGKICSRRGKC